MEYKKTAADFSSAAVFLFAFVWGNFGEVLPETLFISIPVFLRIFRAVSAGYFALGGKVTKTPPGRPRSPIICLIGRHQI